MGVSRYTVTNNNRRTVTEVNNVTIVQDVKTIQVASMNTFSDGDEIPSVLGGKYLKTANTSSTTITDFDDPPASGYHIVVLFYDNCTTIQHGSDIDMPNGVDQTFATGDVMEFLWNGTKWFGWNSRTD